MYTLEELTGQSGEKKSFSDECVIGRQDDVDLVLPDPSVSRRHARIFSLNSQWYVEDLESSNGTLVNGVRIEKQGLKSSDIITVGRFKVRFEDTSSVSDSGDSTISVSTIKPATQPVKASVQISEEEVDGCVLLKKKIHEQLLSRMDLKMMSYNKENTQALREKVTATVDAIIKDMQSTLPKGVQPRALAKEIVDEAIGLGPLEDFLADDSVTEIMVNNKDQIYVESKGKLRLSGKKFISDEQIRAVIERIVAPLGRRIDESSPLVDARLKDGSRVNAIIPPLALKGCCITIRKFSKTPFVIGDIVKFGSLTKEMGIFLEMAVQARQNIVISGGTGSGKTTLLNVLSSFIPSDDRIVTIEDAAELKLPQEHVVSLESRPPNIEGKGAVSIRDLVKNALRMRPDRIVVGECRGGEALDMLQAMNTGHDGSLTTGHANSPRDILSRLETMVMMAGMDLPSRAIREQICSAVHIIVQQSRFSDGTRKVTNITEVTGIEENTITLQDIFVYKQTGISKEHKVEGYFTATGFIPKFVEDLEAKGIPVDRSVFIENKEALKKKEEKGDAFGW